MGNLGVGETLGSLIKRHLVNGKSYPLAGFVSLLFLILITLSSLRPLFLFIRCQLKLHQSPIRIKTGYPVPATQRGKPWGRILGFKVLYKPRPSPSALS